MVVLKAILPAIPEQLRSDNGPQFNSAEFAQFAKEWGFHLNTTSPKFPQANGEVERAVKTVKSVLKKEKDSAKALLALLGSSCISPWIRTLLRRCTC